MWIVIAHFTLSTVHGILLALLGRDVVAFKVCLFFDVVYMCWQLHAFFDFLDSRIEVFHGRRFIGEKNSWNLKKWTDLKHREVSSINSLFILCKTTISWLSRIGLIPKVILLEIFLDWLEDVTPSRDAWTLCVDIIATTWVEVLIFTCTGP